MPDQDDLVSIALPRDQALALFEWAYRFMEHGNPTFTHPADVVAVDRLAAELERTLTEPFRDDYPHVLAQSRESAVAKYRAHMGQKHSEWLDRLDYQDYPAKAAV